jgi:hypothetical protein
MASLLTATQKANFEKGISNLFDTFKQDIIVYKEPKVVITDINKPRVFGYNENSDIQNINYIPVTGVFSAIVKYKRDQKEERLGDTANLIDYGQVDIKVKSDANDFIQNNGATINISINDLMFKIVSSQSVRRYISSEYYHYILERER